MLPLAGGEPRPSGCPPPPLPQEHRERVPFPEQQLLAAGFSVRRVPGADLDPDWSSDDIAVYSLRLADAS